MNKKLAIKILIILSIISIFVLFFILKKSNNTKIDPVLKNINIDEIKIGSSKEEIDKLIGTEIESTKSGELTLNTYKSENIYRPHQIYYQDNLSELIIEEITDKSVTTDDMRKKYGVASNVLYEKLEHSTFNLFVYIDKGIAYQGHESGGLVLEIWYFKPTDIKTFINKYAQNYQETPYTEQTGY